jgi:small conductance mechanosensitive channel
MQPELATKLDALFRAYIAPLGWHLLGAVAVWIAGGWAIALIRSTFHRTLRLRHVDATLCRYLDASVAVVLRVLLLIAVLGVLGIQTTSFAALIAAAGIAVGAAWAGLLSNFAAGLFLLTFRPFKVGDVISAGGTTGTVREIGLFVTSIDTPDGVLTYVGNNRLFSDNVQNFSANPFRRVDLTAQLPQGADVVGTIDRLRELVRGVPNVLPEPGPRVEILALTTTGSTLAVQPFCRNEHYWQVYFDTNRMISQLFAGPSAAAVLPAT